MLIVAAAAGAQSITNLMLGPMSQHEITNGIPVADDHVLLDPSRISLAERVSSAPKLFNGQQRTTRDITVSGLDVVIGIASGNDIWERVQNRPDIASFTVSGRDVTIEGRLTVPGAKVTVIASNVVFRADSASEAGIDTSGISATLLPEESIAGIDGQSAGDITIACEQVTWPSTSIRLLTVNGGNGGPGGLGKDGQPGTGVPTVPLPYTSFNGDDGIPHDRAYYVIENWVVKSKQDPVPQPATTRGSLANASLVKNGTDALAPGKPGEPGNSGNIRIYSSDAPATLEQIRPLIQGVPGSAGAAAPTARGGPGAGTFYACYVDVNRVRGEAWLHASASVTSASGKDAPAPLPTNANGSVGQIQLLGGRPLGSWVTAEFLSQTLSSAKSFYRGAQYSEARRQLDGARGLLNLIQDTLEFRTIEEVTSLMVMKQEIDILLGRLSRGENIAGDPPGSVPFMGLSSQALLYAASVERFCVNRALISLAQSSDSAAERKKSLLDLNAEVATQRLSKFMTLTTSFQELSGLVSLDRQLETEVSQVTQDLHAAESSFLEEARHDQRKAGRQGAFAEGARFLAVALQLVPSSSSTVAGLEKAAVIASAVLRDDDPYEKAVNIGALFYAPRDLFVPAMATFVESVNKLDFDTDPWGSLSTMAKAGQPVIDAGSALLDAADGLRIAPAMNDALLAKIRMEHPELRTMALQVQLLQQMKIDLIFAYKRVMASVLSTKTELHALANAEGVITTELNRLDQAVLEPQTQRHLRTFESLDRTRMYRAVEDLRRIVEHVTLTPYSESVDLVEQLSEDIDDAVGGKLITYPPTEGALSAQRSLFFKSLFELSVARLALANTNVGSTYSLTVHLNSFDLNRLDAGQQVTINPYLDGMLRGRCNAKVIDVTLQPRVKPGQRHERIANSTVRVTHSGEGLLKTRAGALHRFTYDQARKWGVTIDALADPPTVRPIEPDLNSVKVWLDVLAGLAGRPPVGGETTLTVPAAWADFVVTKEDLTTNGESIELDDLAVEFTLAAEDYALGDVLVVPVPGSFAGTFVLGTDGGSDRLGRTNGAGFFLRSFGTSTKVTLTAPSADGLVWVGWRRGERLETTDRTVTLNLNSGSEFVLAPTYRTPVWIRREPNQKLILESLGGTWESSLDSQGPYVPTGAASSVVPIEPSESRRFFRVRN